MRYPTRFQQKTLWNAATGVSILILGVLLVGLVWLTGRVFGFLQPVLIPLIVAGIVAYVLDPVVRLLEKRGLSRLWSVVTLFLALLAAATLLVAAVIPGIQRGHGTLKALFTSSQSTPETPAPKADASAEASDDKLLGAALVRELREIQKNYPSGPVAWLLAEAGLTVPAPDALPDPYPAGEKAAVLAALFSGPVPEGIDSFMAGLGLLPAQVAGQWPAEPGVRAAGSA